MTNISLQSNSYNVEFGSDTIDTKCDTKSSDSGPPNIHCFKITIIKYIKLNNLTTFNYF